jgi:HSP20 family protein
MTALVVRRSSSLIEEFERMFEPTFYRPLYVSRECCGMMSLDAYEIKDEFIVKAELPGVQKENLDIKLDGDMLQIEAQKKAEEETIDHSYICERDFGSFYRTLSLPFPVDGGKASASFENGVLEIRLPKAEEAKSKHIEVKVK